MTRTIHRTYDSWKTASPDDEWRLDDDRPERDPDADRDDHMDEQMQKERIQAMANRPETLTLEELREIEVYLDNRADVDDGIPNEAMRLLTKLRTIIRMLEGR